MRRPMNPQRPGRGSEKGGWTQPLDELWTQLRAEMHAFKQRVDADVNGPAGIPAAYQGVRVFRPEVGELTVTDPSVFPNVDIDVNYVVRDGQTYEIPVIFPGPGVFVARELEVHILQRFVTSAGEDFRLVARAFNTTLAQNVDQDSELRTFRYSVLQQFDGTPGNPESWPSIGGPSAPLVVHEDPVPACNFFWNIIDAKSGRQFADDLVPSQALMPLTASHAGLQEITFDVIQGQRGLPLDGGRFYFDVPWLIERDGQLRFQFRPTTPIFQLASTPTNEKQDVYVQVELHGERYETLPDALKTGALTRPVRREEE